MDVSAEILRSIIAIFTSVVGATIVYYLIEARIKRRIETYWKIEDQYKSDVQQQARKSLYKISQDLDNKRKQLLNEGFVKSEIEKKVEEYYNHHWHEGEDDKMREESKSSRYRIRFLHQIGILLRKKMIDKDLLFSLIGLGFEIDYPKIEFELRCHRNHHNTPKLYNHVEYLWKEYIKWRENSKFMK